jgi:glycosyltransferase involved in cell wall biosynthesis
MLKIAQRFDADIHCIWHNPGTTFPEFKDINVVTPKKPPLGFGDLLLVASNHFHNLKMDGYDVINPHVAPAELVGNRNPNILWYCHTPYRYAYDLYGWNMGRLGFPRNLPFRLWSALFKRLEAKTVPKIGHIFTPSLNSKGRIGEYLERDAEVLHPGVEPSDFRCRGYERFFFYPSRFIPEKRFEHAIEAFKRFSSRNPGWKLVIAGSLLKSWQAYYDKLKAMTDDSVIFETNISDERMLDLYSRCHSVLFTPVDEDFGLVPLEAMAASKPCIATREGGTLETVVDGKDGFLVDSIDGMAGKMELLAKDAELCERLGKAGRDKVCKRFTWEIFLKRFGEKAREMADKQ